MGKHLKSNNFMACHRIKMFLNMIYVIEIVIALMRSNKSQDAAKAKLKLDYVTI